MFKDALNINNKMDTDNNFRTFLQANMEINAYKNLLKVESSDPSQRPNKFIQSLASQEQTLLMIMAEKKLSDDILGLVDKFLASLTPEEASNYIFQTLGAHYSAMFLCQDIACLTIMIKYVQNVNTQNFFGNNMLASTFARLSDTRMLTSASLNKIKFLLENKINVNAKNHFDRTPLMYLCEKIEYSTPEIFEEVLELLIFNGANIFVVSNSGTMAYDYVKIDRKYLLSEKSSQLLQGIIKMNRTKRAI